MMKLKAKEASGKENEDRLYDESPNRRSQSGKLDRHPVNSLSGRENEERIAESTIAIGKIGPPVNSLSGRENEDRLYDERIDDRNRESGTDVPTSRRIRNV